MNKEVFLKTGLSLVISFLLTTVLTKFVFYPEAADLRPKFAKIFDRVISPVIGFKGEPVEVKK